MAEAERNDEYFPRPRSGSCALISETCLVLSSQTLTKHGRNTHHPPVQRAFMFSGAEG
jgi:hypothetical protein